MSDTDRLAAETRRLLDACPSQGTVDYYTDALHRAYDERDDLAARLARTEALGDYWGSVIFRLAAEVDRLRAEVHQWEMSDALQRDPDVQQQFIDTLTAERDRLADENRALREAILDAVTELGLAHEPDWASDKAKADGKDPVWCRICGPADGSWPCTSQMVVTDLLAAADRGVTDGDRNEGERT